MIEMIFYLLGSITNINISYGIGAKDLLIEVQSYIYYLRNGKYKILSQFLRTKIKYV